MFYVNAAPFRVPLAHGMLLIPPNATASVPERCNSCCGGTSPMKTPTIRHRTAPSGGSTTALVQELDDTALRSGHALLDGVRAHDFSDWVDRTAAAARGVASRPFVPPNRSAVLSDADVPRTGSIPSAFARRVSRSASLAATERPGRQRHWDTRLSLVPARFRFRRCGTCVALSICAG